MRNIKLLAIVVATLFVLSCSDSGGGGSDGGTLTPATVDESTAAKSVSMVLAATPLMDLSEDYSILSISGVNDPNKNIAAWVLDRVRDEILSTGRLHPAGSETYTDNCDSGSMTMKITWDGSDTIADCSQVSDVEATMQFDQCQSIDAYTDTYTNGTIHLSIPGNLCDPSEISMDFTNVTIQSEEVNINANNFSLDFFISGDTTTVTFDGDLSVSSDGVSEAMNFIDFVFTDTETYTGNSTRINGFISSSCFSGWVTFTTIEPVVTSYSDDCPTSGQVKVSGTGEITVTFNTDGSVTVGTLEYPSCLDLPQTCQ